MKKFWLSFYLLIAAIGSAFADDELFYRKTIGADLDKVGSWLIIGRYGNSELNEGCAMGTRWSDGSWFWFIKDLKDGEVYIDFQNNSWNIGDKPGEYKMRINFKFANRIEGGEFVFQLMNKNTIMIRGIVGNFAEYVFSAREMQFIMPGNISNASISLKNTQEAISSVIDCVKESKNHKLNRGGKIKGKDIEL